jgi:hypothetical protein
MVSDYNDAIDEYNEGYAIYLDEYEYYKEYMKLQSYLKLKPGDKRRQIAELRLINFKTPDEIGITGEYLEEKEAALKSTKQELLKYQTEVETELAALEKFEEDLKLMKYQINDLEKNFGTGKRSVPVSGIVKEIHVFWGNE